MTITLGINGFGRIGRCTLAHIAEAARNDVQVVKINATGPIETNAHLLKYDSVHGRFGRPVTVTGNTLDLGQGPIQVQSTYDPTELDWDGCDVVLECTGKFNDGQASAVHLDRGAKKVLISAPAKDVDRTVVYGVNHRDLTPAERMVSNGSCTTNCLAPLASVLDATIGIERGIMTTIHSYTGDQPTLDRRHADLYRARAAAMAMIPTSTGAAKAIGEVLPSLAGKLDGTAMRVPTPNVSAVDLTFEAGKSVSVEDVNAVVAEAAAGYMGMVMAYDDEAKVSIDFNHTTQSCIFAPDQTKVVGGKTVRVLAWYDNEWGFSARMADVAATMGRLHQTGTRSTAKPAVPAYLAIGSGQEDAPAAQQIQGAFEALRRLPPVPLDQTTTVALRTAEANSLAALPTSLTPDAYPPWLTPFDREKVVRRAYSGVRQFSFYTIAVSLGLALFCTWLLSRVCKEIRRRDNLVFR